MSGGSLSLLREAIRWHFSMQHGKAFVASGFDLASSLAADAVMIYSTENCVIAFDSDI